MQCDFNLPNGDLRVDENNSINTVKTRLEVLFSKLDYEGSYTRANTVSLALEAIELLQRHHGYSG